MGQVVPIELIRVQEAGLWSFYGRGLRVYVELRYVD
jgi:hypothetical protein